VAYIVCSAAQLPLSLVALAGAAGLLVGGLCWGQVGWKDLGKEISWSIFGFIAGMFVVVQGVENVGLTAQFGQIVGQVAGANILTATLLGTAGAALGANLINNLPMALVLVATIGALRGGSPGARLGLIAATIFGCDLGPNLTTVGSLATVLWLLLLRRRGVEVSSGLFSGGHHRHAHYAAGWCAGTLAAAAPDLKGDDHMRALLCLDGTNTERLVQRALPLLPAQALQITLLYVVDSGPGQDYERLRQRYLGMGERGAHLLAQMAQAEQAHADEILTSARAALLAAWPQGAHNSQAVQAIALRGKPEQEIARFPLTTPVDLIVLGARRVRAPGEPPPPPGPKSIGHVARFVLDHAPCPVLLIRP
jgi:nucleotide-binding universal stress UspA family protein